MWIKELCYRGEAWKARRGVVLRSGSDPSAGGGADGEGSPRLGRGHVELGCGAASAQAPRPALKPRWGVETLNSRPVVFKPFNRDLP